MFKNLTNIKKLGESPTEEFYTGTEFGTVWDVKVSKVTGEVKIKSGNVWELL